MALPESYTLKPNALPTYFDTILKARAPERFSQKFLESLGFKSTNDRLFIGILRDLGFIDSNNVPTDRYYRFHDRTQSKVVIAEGIREAYSDLFAVDQEANQLSLSEVANKLRTLFQGQKTDNIIDRIARTFVGLCELADFQTSQEETLAPGDSSHESTNIFDGEAQQGSGWSPKQSFEVSSLQYHVNIVLPNSRDQAVYDAIFRALREHLG